MRRPERRSIPARAWARARVWKSGASAAFALAALLIGSCGDGPVAGPGTGMETGNTLAGILMMDSATPAAGAWVFLSASQAASPGPATKRAARKAGSGADGMAEGTAAGRAASAAPLRDSALTDGQGRFRFEVPGPDTLSLLLESRLDSAHHIRLPIVKAPGVGLDLGRVYLQAWLKAGWELTFQEEFDADGLDTVSRWVPREDEPQVREGERHAVVPEALDVRDGRLVITAERRKADFAGAVRDYTSGTAATKGRFAQQYGRFEVRCRFPGGPSVRPTLWMMADTTPQIWPPEIILPVQYAAPDSLFMSFRGDGDVPVSRDAAEARVAPPPDGFRVVAVEWSPEALRWYVDGELRHEYKGPGIPDRPMYLLLHLAVGGVLAAGDPDADAGFPYAFEVDYVRVYRQSP